MSATKPKKATASSKQEKRFDSPLRSNSEASLLRRSPMRVLPPTGGSSLDATKRKQLSSSFVSKPSASSCLSRGSECSVPFCKALRKASQSRAGSTCSACNSASSRYFFKAALLRNKSAATSLGEEALHLYTSTCPSRKARAHASSRREIAFSQSSKTHAGARARGVRGNSHRSPSAPRPPALCC